MKRCKGCKQLKVLEDFPLQSYKNKAGVRKPYGKCRVCTRARNKIKDARWEATPAGKASVKRSKDKHAKTAKRKASQARHHATPEWKAKDALKPVRMPRTFTASGKVEQFTESIAIATHLLKQRGSDEDKLASEACCVFSRRGKPHTITFLTKVAVYQVRCTQQWLVRCARSARLRVPWAAS